MGITGYIHLDGKWTGCDLYHNPLSYFLQIFAFEVTRRTTLNAFRDEMHLFIHNTWYYLDRENVQIFRLIGWCKFLCSFLKLVKQMRLFDEGVFEVFVNPDSFDFVCQVNIEPFLTHLASNPKFAFAWEFGMHSLIMDYLL